MESLNNSMNSTLLYDGGKRCTIFVIDFGEHVFADDNGEKQFKLSLQIVRDRINYLCCTGGLSELAIVIFVNTTNTNKEAENIDCMFIHRSIGNLDADYVKKLDFYLKAENIRKELGKELGYESGFCNFGEIFFLCQRLFTYSGNVIRRREIFFFTVDHDPIMGDYNITRKVNSYINDLKLKGTQLCVCLANIALKYDSESYEFGEVESEESINPFWKEIDPNVLQFSSYSRVRKEIMRKDISLRTYASVALRLGYGVELAVGIYYLIKEQYKPVSIPLDSETNEVLECRSHYVSVTKNDEKILDHKNSGNEINSKVEEHFEGEVNFMCEIGGSNVVLDRSELEELRRFDEPGITIIGFKPLHLLKYSHRMGESKFVLPLEDAIAGSSTLYKALFRKCVERGLFILVRSTEKINTTPKLAALIPQERSSSFVNEEYRYEGFHLIELPYSEDKRNLEDKIIPPNNVENWPTASDASVDAAKAFVKRLTTKYAPHQFSNPVLQKFYNGLEAVALDLDIEDNNLDNKKFDNIRNFFINFLSFLKIFISIFS